jgi:uncharacterized protein YraI
MKLKGVLVAAMLLAPTAALAAPGVVTTSVSMRAGPGPGFPVVGRVPGGSRVNVHGCIRGDAWCDVSWSADRGWVSSQYLKYFYRNRYVYLPDNVDVVDVPVVPFVLDSYWASYYAGRPWYHRHAYWNGYWRSHARFATQIPAIRSARFGRTESRTAITEGRMRPGVAPGAIRQQRFVHGHGAPVVQGGVAPVNGAGRTLSRAHAPMAGTHAAARFTAPAARPAMSPRFAQPNPGQATIGRVGGPPMNAHAQQMGGPRAAPAMPHMGGGAPHIAPRIGGGPAAGPGHQRP